MIFFTKWMLVSPLAQWLGVCQMSNLSGNWVSGWHRSVLPSYRIWNGGSSPMSVPAKVTVICCLSPALAIPTLALPRSLWVHCEDGMTFNPVWSQFMTCYGEILPSLTAFLICWKYRFLTAANSSWVSAALVLVVAFLFTKPILLRSE